MYYWALSIRYYTPRASNVETSCVWQVHRNRDNSHWLGLSILYLFCFHSASLSFYCFQFEVCVHGGRAKAPKQADSLQQHSRLLPAPLPSPYSHPKFMPWWLNLIKNNMGNNQESAQSWITSFYGHAPAPAVSKRPDNINKRKRQLGK